MQKIRLADSCSDTYLYTSGRFSNALWGRVQMDTFGKSVAGERAKGQTRYLQAKRLFRTENPRLVPINGFHTALQACYLECVTLFCPEGANNLR